jgi:hypothetical protein
MSDFISKWQEADVKGSNIATLAYPYIVKSINGEGILEIGTVEQAENLLDWYKSNYEHGKITQGLVKRSPAFRKLQAAAARFNYIEARDARHAAEAVAFAASDKALATSKEGKRAARLAGREALAMAEWSLRRSEAMQGVIDAIAANTKVIAKLPADVGAPDVRENYLKMSAQVETLAALVGAFRTQYHATTASRFFAVHQK